MAEKNLKGKKSDIGKIRWDCVPMEIIEGIAKVMTYGANKYNEDPEDPNWIKVEKGEQRYYAAMMRHLVSDKKGETIDKDSGLEHLDHFLFNAMAYIYFKRKKHNEKI